MSEESEHYGLPDDVWGLLLPPDEGSALSGAHYQAGACQATCCNQGDPFWWRYLTSGDEDRRFDASVSSSRAMVAAWVEAHGPEPTTNYRGEIAAYFEGWHEFEINWAKAGRVEINAD